MNFVVCLVKYSINIMDCFDYDFLIKYLDIGFFVMVGSITYYFNNFENFNCFFDLDIDFKNSNSYDNYFLCSSLAMVLYLVYVDENSN